jgi:hypothetical protein
MMNGKRWCKRAKNRNLRSQGKCDARIIESSFWRSVPHEISPGLLFACSLPWPAVLKSRRTGAGDANPLPQLPPQAAADACTRTPIKDKGRRQGHAPIPPEKTVATHHELALGGKTLKYTATAGTLLIRDEEDKPYGSIFYVAYTLDGADAQSRPVSFLYNGGPARPRSGCTWARFRRCALTDSPNATAGPPFKLVPNEYSLLDKTDLVFIDAPLTGYSRAVGKGRPRILPASIRICKAFDRFISATSTPTSAGTRPSS